LWLNNLPKISLYIYYIPLSSLSFLPFWLKLTKYFYRSSWKAKIFFLGVHFSTFQNSKEFSLIFGTRINFMNTINENFDDLPTVQSAPWQVQSYLFLFHPVSHSV